MAIQKEIKKLFKSHRRDDICLPTTSPETNSDSENAEVDLDLTMDAIHFSQDFGSWFGKSIFDNELAIVVYKNFSGHTNITFLDVLEMVAMLYNSNSTGAVKATRSTDIFSVFYCSLYSSRCNLDEADWAKFRSELSSRIAASCEKLRKEKTVELHAISVSPQSVESRAATLETAISCGNLFSSLPPASTSGSGSYAPAAAQQQGSIERPSGTEHSRQILQSLVNPAAPLVANIPPFYYISALHEHASAHGKIVTYDSARLDFEPPLFHQKATYEGMTGEGTGRSLKLAKYAAAKHLYDNIGFAVVQSSRAITSTLSILQKS